MGEHVVGGKRSHRFYIRFEIKIEKNDARIENPIKIIKGEASIAFPTCLSSSDDEYTSMYCVRARMIELCPFSFAISSGVWLRL